MIATLSASGVGLLTPMAVRAGAESLVNLSPQDDPLRERLAWWQSLKFGLFVHWGAYSQLGCIESWPLVFADRKWSNPPIQSLEEMKEFHHKYWALNQTFNPTKFNPSDWARAAKRAGMKYVVFTSKHHDGFNMYGTKLSDYGVTGTDCPYSRSRRPDIVKRLFDTFRKEGFAIGCYYSKADWHHPDYWAPEPFPFPTTRNPNYDTAQHPDKWQRFVNFVHNQIEELMTGYGHIDILWLDAGQVRPPKQDLQMDRLVAMARKHQPHLIVVDRTAGTQHENYRTPEQQVPDKPLSYPWETCMTMGTQWSFKPDDAYKSTQELIHLLVDIVAKGGNFLLNIGAQPDGQLPPVALQRLREIGEWMTINGEAIYGTTPVAPYKEGRIAFTQRGATTYAVYLPDREEAPPRQLAFTGAQPAPGSEIRLLGVKQPLKWSVENRHVIVQLPDSMLAAAKHALVLAIKTAG